jgi:hypothetical protein
MIVISDTTPLNYLVLIDQQELLAQLFKRAHVEIPQEAFLAVLKVNKLEA